VQIADTVTEFVAAVEAAMNQNPDKSEWLYQVDAFLKQTSWDSTWARMIQLVESVMSDRLSFVSENAIAAPAQKIAKRQAVKQATSVVSDFVTKD
jgi:UDP-galactopyranose mutase